MLSLRSSKYILANISYVYRLSIESQLTNLSIDISAFKKTKLRAVLREPCSTGSHWGSRWACNEKFGVRIGYVRLFRYQHVGISNAKCSRWVSRPMRVPNANGFGFWWNI